VQLSDEGARVLGSLVEKALSTPQQYPLTLSALVAACNQTSNREPVVNYDEQTVQAALDELKDLRLVRFVLPSHGRSVVRYRQVLDENLGLDSRQSAVLAVLLLRGPQTVGELRLRTERMSRFDGLDEIEHELDLLGARDDPLAANVGRRLGQKEERWASLLTGTAERGPVPVTDDRTDVATFAGPGVAVAPPADQRPPGPDRVDGLRSEVADLRVEVAELRHALDELRASLGG
jgi:uncharacterized protein YceH (UPF0502 family)